jgi:hypothetical protein
MPSDVEVARARAAAAEAEAKVLEAERAAEVAAQPPVTAAAPEVPAAEFVPAPVAAAQQGPQPPPGKAPLQSLDEANSLPLAEVVARMDEVEHLERQEQH